MIARFHYHTTRHHGKYGTAVSVFNSRESMHNGDGPIAYFRTYKYQNPDGSCDGEKQVECLRAKVLKNFHDVEFIN